MPLSIGERLEIFYMVLQRIPTGNEPQLLIVVNCLIIHLLEGFLGGPVG